MEALNMPMTPPPRDTDTLAWSTLTVRAKRPKRVQPHYVPTSAWEFYDNLRKEDDLTINGIKFKNVHPSKQKKTLDAIEDFFDRLFHGESAKEMWRYWNAHYKDRDAVAFTKAVFDSYSQLDVFRKREADAKKEKSKLKISAASKKLKGLIQSQNFILGLKAHCWRTRLIENLDKLETFISTAEYGYDASPLPTSPNLARQGGLKHRKSVPHVDFLRQLAMNLSLGVQLDKDLNFLILLLACFHPAPADKPYTIENIRRNLS